MARAPFNVVVYLHRCIDDNLKYAIFQRADAGFWQGVSGGGEENETPLQAAIRETQEETGLAITAGWIQLQTSTRVPVTVYTASWDEELFVIPIYYFAAPASQQQIKLSHEHLQMSWLPYKDAYQRLNFDADRTALWELNQQLLKKGPRD